MNLLELKKAVEAAIEKAKDYADPEEIDVSLQIDIIGNDGGCQESVYSSEHVELHYDNDGCASGCVLTAITVRDIADKLTGI